MAKRKRKKKGYQLGKITSRAIYLACRSGIRREMRRRASACRPKKKKPTYSYVPDERINGRPVTYMCFEDYDVTVHTKDELEFMLSQGLKVDFQNDRYDVALEKQKLNKQMLALYRKQKIELEKQKHKLTIMSIIAVGIILTIGIVVL